MNAQRGTTREKLWRKCFDSLSLYFITHKLSCPLLMSCTQSSKQGWLSCIWVQLSNLWPSAMLVHSWISISIPEISITDMSGSSSSFPHHSSYTSSSPSCEGQMRERVYLQPQNKYSIQILPKIRTTGRTEGDEHWISGSLFSLLNSQCHCYAFTDSPMSRSLVDSSPENLSGN